MQQPELQVYARETLYNKRIMKAKIQELKRMYYDYRELNKELLDLSYIDDTGNVEFPEEADPVREELENLIDRMKTIQATIEALEKEADIIYRMEHQPSVMVVDNYYEN